MPFPFTLIGSFLGSISTAISSGYKAKKETEQQQIKAKKDVILAEGELALAKIKGKIAAVERRDNQTHDYDMLVLKNRNNTVADEFIIVLWFSVFVFHFLPWTQPFMGKGWIAMGYKDGPAWWFEFGMVGILVSTLGLMRVLKIFLQVIRGYFTQDETIKAKKIAD